MLIKSLIEIGCMSRGGQYKNNYLDRAFLARLKQVHTSMYLPQSNERTVNSTLALGSLCATTTTNAHIKISKRYSSQVNME